MPWACLPPHRRVSRALFEIGPALFRADFIQDLAADDQRLVARHADGDSRIVQHLQHQPVVVGELRVGARVVEDGRIDRTGIVGQPEDLGQFLLNDPNRQLRIRRSKLRDKLLATYEARELESLCAAALATTALNDVPGEMKADGQNDA